MRILQILFFCIFLGIDVVGFVFSYRLSRDITFGKITSAHKILGTSILLGSMSGLILITMVMLLAIQDIAFKWTITGIIGILFVALVLTFIGTLGSLLGFFIMGKYRIHLFDKLKK
jgi:hypothetical protein